MGSDTDNTEARRLANVFSWTALFGVAVSALPVVIQIGSYLSDHNWIGASICVVFLLFLAYLAWKVLPKAGPTPPRPTRIFQPFARPEDLQVWPRSAQVDKLVESIKSASKVTVVVGPSGAGKTVLLRNLLRAALDKDGHCVHYFDTYQGIETELANALSLSACRQELPAVAPAPDVKPATLPPRRVVILDQFEQFLAYSSELKSVERDRLRAWMLSTIRGSDTTHFVLGVRREWYYELRFLGNLVPGPAECALIEPPAVDGSSETYSTIVGRFEKALGDPATARAAVDKLDSGGYLLPLEVQIVGASLEQLMAEGVGVNESYIRDQLFGPEGAIESYFNRVLDGAPDRRVAVKVLFALAVRTRFRRQERLVHILDSLYESPPVVRHATEYLCSSGLVVERDLARYELAHDYLAEYFHYMSGNVLHPTDRDNILYHLDLPAANEPEPKLVRPLTGDSDGKHTSRFGYAIIGPLMILMFLRLLGLTSRWTRAKGPVGTHLLVGNTVLDGSYLPIFVAHGAWALYVFLFYQRVFSHLRETRWHRALSLFAVVNMAGCVVAAMRWPEIWVASIGWGGFVIGLKLVSIARQREINSVTAERIGHEIGFRTVANLAFLTLGGIAAAVLTQRLVHSAAHVRNWTFTALLVSIVLTYAALALGPVHVSEEAASRTLSLMARSSRPVVPRVDR